MTASISWPESDLGLPLTETYEIAYTSRVVGSDLDIDPVILRRLDPNQNRQISCSWFWTRDQMAIFREFYYRTLKQGSRAFRMRVWTEAGYLTGDCVFMGAFEARKANFEWRVQASIFLSPYDTVSEIDQLSLIATAAGLRVNEANAFVAVPVEALATAISLSTDQTQASVFFTPSELFDIAANIAALNMTGRQAQVPGLEAFAASLGLTGQFAQAGIVLKVLRFPAASDEGQPGGTVAYRIRTDPDPRQDRDKVWDATPGSPDLALPYAEREIGWRFDTGIGQYEWFLPGFPQLWNLSGYYDMGISSVDAAGNETFVEVENAFLHYPYGYYYIFDVAMTITGARATIEGPASAPGALLASGTDAILVSGTDKLRYI